MVKNNEELFLLYDCYKKLLTKNQIDCFELYFMYDTSLVEIGEQLGISKQAVKDTIDKAKTNLAKYEDALHLADKYKRYNAIRQQKHDLECEEYAKLLEKLIEE